MDGNYNVSFESSELETLDDVNKSLSVICLDDVSKSLSVICLDDENEKELDKEPTDRLESQFCSSTPIRVECKQQCHHKDSANDLKQPPHVDLFTSFESCQAVTQLTKDDDYIDASMYTVSIAESEESRLENFLCNELVPPLSMGKRNDKVNSKVLDFYSYQPSTIAAKTTKNDKKNLRRQKFLRDKQKKKLAAVRSMKNEEKENKPNPTNLTILNTEKQENQDVNENTVRCVLQVIQNWIGDAPPEKKDGDRMVQEFISDDQKENLDINDPEWDNMKCLKTDEERYKAVKTCWQSQRAPNPQRDLTFHSYRNKRISKWERKPLLSKKRTATGNIDFPLVAKLRKVEEAPCTLFLDRKITDAEKQFTNQQNDHLLSFNQTNQKLDNDYAEKNRNVMKEYNRELNRIKYMNASYRTRSWLRMSLKNWMHTQKEWLHENLLREKQRAKEEENKMLNNLNNNHSFTIKKLKEARNEVLKFNQFYCGLNKIDTTVLKGQFLEETVALEDMYLTYEKHYGPAH